MANQLLLFLTEDDERIAVRILARHFFEVYPRRIPPDWRAYRLTAESPLPADAAYLVASDLGPALTDKVKRGPDKGSLRIDESHSPVVFFERCAMDERGELSCGQLWSELHVTAQSGRKVGQSDAFRTRVMEVESKLKRALTRSEPRGYYIGPSAARLHKAGALKLRGRDRLIDVG